MADTKVTLTFELTDGTTQDVSFVVPGGADGAPGPAGDPGPAGASAYDIYVETTDDDPVKSEEDWLDGLQGADGADGADGVGIVSVTATTAPVPPVDTVTEMEGQDGVSGAVGDTVTAYLSVLPVDTTGPLYIESEDETIATVPVNTPVVQDTDGNGYNASFDVVLVAEGTTLITISADLADGSRRVLCSFDATVTAAD